MKRMNAKQKRHQVRKSRKGNTPKKRRRGSRNRERMSGHSMFNAAMFTHASAVMTSLLLKRGGGRSEARRRNDG